MLSRTSKLTTLTSRRLFSTQLPRMADKNPIHETAEKAGQAKDTNPKVVGLGSP
jgi:hypothetical protein